MRVKVHEHVGRPQSATDRVAVLRRRRVGRKPRRSLKADVVAGGATPAIQAKSSPASPARSTIDAVFGGLGGIDYRLSTGGYVSGDDLAAAIEANPGDTLPDRVRDYLCRF